MRIRQFHWLHRRSAWQQLQSERAGFAKANSNFENNVNNANVTIFAALNDQISGSANNAAKAAVKRIQAAAKAASDANSKKLQQAQDLLSQTQSGLNTSSGSSSTTTTTGTVLNSVA